jgi:hypothetical protein
VMSGFRPPRSVNNPLLAALKLVKAILELELPPIVVVLLALPMVTVPELEPEPILVLLLRRYLGVGLFRS